VQKKSHGGSHVPTIKISLDAKSFRRLADVAFEQRRAIPMQAEVLVLQALGNCPVLDSPTTTDRRQAPVKTGV
jgi:hypothetical protein